MSEIINKIDNLIQEFQDKKAQLVNQLKVEFPNLFTHIFEKYPNLEAFQWTQYTPYFNDGDECTFGVNDAYYIKRFQDEEFVAPYKEDGNRKIAKEINSILVQIDNDSMRTMFGDSVEVKLYKDGTIKIDEYDHE